MKNKILFISLIIIIMAFIIALGYTNARYYSTASMTGNLDVVPIIDKIGQISIYNPELVYGYTVLEDGTGVFNVPSIPIEYANIHYSVTNKLDNKINEEQIEYYIRIVAEDGSDNIPIEYDVHEYDNTSNIYNKVAGVGYGPFTLKAFVEETQHYSIRANYIKYSTDIQHLKVQMIKKESDNTLTVMSEAPLNMQYTGNNVTVNFRYFLYGMNTPIEIIDARQTLNMPDNFIIDFTNEELLNDLKISFPENYIFHDARSELNGWAESSSITIPEGNLAVYHIEVYMTSSDVVPIILNYYDYSTSSSIDQVYVIVNRGITIDFTNLTQLNDLQIPMPDNYVLKGLGGALVTNPMVDTFVKIPSTTTDNYHYINIYMYQKGNATVNVSYYNWRIDNEYSVYLLSEHTIEVPMGTKIDFTDTESLTTLGISIPNGYTLEKAYCSSIDSTGTGSSEYTIPMGGAASTYDIDVVLLGSTITVPVKFVNTIYEEDKEIGTEEIKTMYIEIDLENSNGAIYNFDTNKCQELCPELNKTSYTIYIANNSYFQVGNTVESEGTGVTVDCNNYYSSQHSLKIPGTYIYIKAWW